MQKVWINNGLNPDNYSAATADAMKAFAVLFANFIGDRNANIKFKNDANLHERTR